MLLVAAALLIGSAIGLGRTPHGRHVGLPRLRLPVVAVVAVVLQMGLFVVGRSIAGPLLGASLIILTCFAVVNRRLVGFGVLAVGLAANATVVVVNGAMPVRASAIVRAEVADATELVDVDLGAGRRHEETDDRLAILGDVVPIAPIHAVVSLGDLISAMGIAAAAGDLVRHARRARPRSERLRALLDHRSPSPTPWAIQVIPVRPPGDDAVLILTDEPPGDPPVVAGVTAVGDLAPAPAQTGSAPGQSPIGSRRS